MTVTTTSTLSPQIKQFFDSRLLSTPCKLNDDEKTIWKLLERFLKKFENQSIDEDLKNKFLEIYGIIQDKKEIANREVQNKVTKKTEQLFYRIECSDKDVREILDGFRYSPSFVASSKFRKNRPLQQIWQRKK